MQFFKARAILVIKLKIENTIREKCPNLRIATIECKVVNSEYSSALWNEIDLFSEDFKSRFKLEDINKRSAIYATRQAYKVLGKDPNRYRPSAEALCRRILRNIPLYQINTLVDLINLISLHSGYSIAGFDANLIEGDLNLGVGKENESFEAIGRGLLNIENLPIYRDKKGGIGTPTSDEERTKIALDTSRLFMIINAYSGTEGLQDAIEFSKTLLNNYTSANDDFQINLY